MTCTHCVLLKVDSHNIIWLAIVGAFLCVRVTKDLIQNTQGVIKKLWPKKAWMKVVKTKWAAKATAVLEIKI